ncbi:MAG TPA: trypsin-like peptidase domain-containing protein [Ferruginibacter sp.]|nr:trypsin-like peptidase domain-containing protein [Bacteroidota bacterium]MCC6693651.1 trypsin-like peptidase domain-containing protein [Chitinophagaceae bacterium]HMT95583.1 trypsin-like peptidase domain-containing protein [Ferruginibacter sp.]HMU23695.1 trypsin-like peptidase domain-containing protein [Ferruginibacter sp.]
MKLKQILATIAISAITALGVIWGYGKFIKPNYEGSYGQQSTLPSNYKYAGFENEAATPPGSVDFTQSAQAAIPAVVHIRTKTNAKQITNSTPRSNPYSDFFGDDDLFNQLFGGGRGYVPEQRASGSGVIISADGYIVTNNHVVADADVVTVSLSNKKTYTAKVIGRDPAYDLAVIKVDASNLPYLLYGNSDNVKIGQWVLAIGYPLNLEATVTAGIISAKARTLGLNKQKAGATAVESYLQTDAAVNQGNSGGALIDTDGKLIGINSAIASPTGYYSGYSYAIPVNITKKVVDDLIKYGTVQRAYLGVSYVDAGDLTPEEKKKIELPSEITGIYVNEAVPDGGAYAAGIRKGDIIKSINNTNLQSGAEMQEQISRFKPGDKINVVYVRNNKEISTTVTLKNKAGNLSMVKQADAMDKLGADLSTLDEKRAKEYGVNGGVVVRKIKDGALNDQTRMKDSFVIIKVDDKDVKSTDDLNKAIADKKTVTLSGFYPGYDGLYDYQVDLDGN